MDGLLIETSNQLYGLSNFFPEEHAQKLDSRSGGVSTHITTITRNAAEVPRLDRALMRIAGDADLMAGRVKPLSGVPEEFSRGRFVVDAAGAPSGVQNQLASKIQSQIDADKEMARRHQAERQSRKEAKRAARAARKHADEEHRLMVESMRPNNPYLRTNGWVEPTQSPHSRKQYVGDYITTGAEIGAGVIGTMAREALNPILVPVRSEASPAARSLSRSPLAVSPHALSQSMSPLSRKLGATGVLASPGSLGMTSGHLTAELMIQQARSGHLIADSNYVGQRALEDDKWLSRMNRTSSLVKNQIEAAHPSERPTEVFLPGSLLRASTDAQMLRSLSSFDTSFHASGAGVTPEEIQRRTMPPGVPFYNASSMHPNGESPMRTVGGKKVRTGDLIPSKFDALPMTDYRKATSPTNALTDAAKQLALSSPSVVVSQPSPGASLTLNEPLLQGKSSYAPESYPPRQRSNSVSTHATRSSASTAKSSSKHVKTMAGGSVDRATGVYHPQAMNQIHSSGLGGARGVERLFGSYLQERKGVQRTSQDKFGAGQELWKGANLHSKQQVSPDNILMPSGGAGLINGAPFALRR